MENSRQYLLLRTDIFTENSRWVPLLRVKLGAGCADQWFLTVGISNYRRCIHSFSSTSTTCRMRRTDGRKCPFLSQLLQIVSQAGQYLPSWFWLSLQKQGRSFWLVGLFHRSSISATRSFLVCCLLLMLDRGWLRTTVRVCFVAVTNLGLCEQPRPQGWG